MYICVTTETGNTRQADDRSMMMMMVVVVMMVMVHDGGGDDEYDDADDDLVDAQLDVLAGFGTKHADHFYLPHG